MHRVTLVALLAPSAPAGAQVRASERGAVSQTVDGTTVTLEYGRPQARGRDTLFGGVVAWGRVWTGANWATTFTTTRPVTVAGQRVPAGSWSLWFHVRPGDWTLILDPEPRRFHMMPPDSSAAQVRATVTPAAGPHAEVLTWTVPQVTPAGMTLRFAWGETMVDVPVRVEPSMDFQVTAEFAARYAGRWQMAAEGPIAGRAMSLELFYDDGMLKGRWDGAPNPLLRAIWMAPRGAGIFWPVETENGEFRDVLADVVFEFTPVEGRADRFEMRALGDNRWAVGTRAN